MAVDGRKELKVNGGVFPSDEYLHIFTWASPKLMPIHRSVVESRRIEKLVRVVVTSSVR